jgi:hypothetical protein
MKALGFCCFLLLLLRGAGRLAIVMGNGEIAEILFVNNFGMISAPLNCKWHTRLKKIAYSLLAATARVGKAPYPYG